MRPSFSMKKDEGILRCLQALQFEVSEGSSTNGQFHVKAWFSSLTKCKLKITIIHSSLPQYLMSNLQIQNVFQALFLFNLSMRECRLRGVKFPLMEKRIYNSRTEWMGSDIKKCRRKDKRENLCKIKMNGVEGMEETTQGASTAFWSKSAWLGQ